MELLQSFLTTNLIYIYFVYGLAFFVFGFSISLAPKPRLPSLSNSVLFFGIFGMMHGLAEWAHVFEMAGNPLPVFIHIGFILVAGLALVEAAIRMFVNLYPRQKWIRSLSFILLVMIEIVVNVKALNVSANSSANAQAWIHYLLFFPGSAIAAWAFFKQERLLDSPRFSLRRDMLLIVGFFALHGLTCGLLMPIEYSPTVLSSNPLFQLPPDTIFNEMDNSVTLTVSSMAATEIFLLTVRTGIALIATLAFLSLLHTFELQRVKELNDAQQAALVAQQQARLVAEERSKELAEDKARTESLYHSILENANDAVFIHDLAGRFLEVNRAACERLGYTRNELLSMDVKQLDAPEIAEDFESAMVEFIKIGSAVLEGCHVRKDGTRIPVELSSRLIDFEGQSAVLTVARDISERKRIEAEIQERNRELDTLYHDAETRAEQIAVTDEIIRIVSSGKSINEIFRSFAEQTRRLVPYSRIGIALIDQAASTMTFIRRYLENGQESQIELTYPLAGSTVEQVVKTKQPWVCPDVNQECQYLHMAKSLLELGLQSSINVPIIWQDQVLGVLNLHSQTPNQYNAKHAQLLEPIARQLAIAIENTRMQNQIKDLAIQSERDRLGRELHDGLGQVLGYFGLKTGEMMELLRLHQIEDAQLILTDLNQAAQIAYADVREAILGLRSTVTTRTGMETTLREYLHRYQREWSIHCELILDGVDKSCIAPSAEIQLLRIIQEALTNIRRHAHAKNAWIKFEHGQDKVLVTIEDDGCGFEVKQPRHEHFGLQTMRERAESVGGSAEIQSEPGRGTRILINLPCPHNERNR